MFDYISKRLTNSISKNLPGITLEKAEQIEYGLYMFISDITKVIAILATSAIIGIFNYSIIAVGVFALHRFFLGGIHSKSQLGCIITYFISIFGIVYISKTINVNNLNHIIFPVAFILAYLYAPADLPSKPIGSAKHRRSLRIIGFIELSFLYLISMLIDGVKLNVLSLTTLLAAMMLTPIVYKLTNNKRSSEIYKEREVKNYEVKI